MSRRLTVTSLLTMVISAMAAAVIALVSLNAWSSLVELRTAGRLKSVADASTSAFKAMHNLRTARAITTRSLEGAPIAPDLIPYLTKIRANQRDAASALLDALAAVQFEGTTSPLEALRSQLSAFSALDDISFGAVTRQEPERPANLDQRYSEASSALLARLETLLSELSALASRKDPVVDQLLELKQFAWLLRNSGGDTTVIVASSLDGVVPTTEIRKKYARLLGAVDMAWSALEGAAARAPVPSKVTDAMAVAKSGYFDPSYVALRDRLLEAPAKGETPEMTTTQWVNFAVARLATAVTLAERALDAAREQAVDNKARALRSLVLQALLLIGALVAAVGSMVGVRRHVIRPLKAIGDATIELAAGNLSVATPYADRRDEIGALAGALSTFKANALEKARMEEREREQGTRAIERQKEIETFIGEFEEQMTRALASLTQASGQMRDTSGGMSQISNDTRAQVKSTEKASGEASISVQSVASASEELSATIADIGRQASQAADIAAHAVEQARMTDRTVHGLADSASRIGEVVELINSIAAQTNLLALNATIEAARAGESGRGFAVVASEVKTLATQTAKATDEISGQISAVQKVANESIDAIKAIGNTIGRVSEVAAAIAAAVEEQGAATREISANTQLAADGTRVVSQGIAGVAAGAEASGSAAQDVMKAAHVLDSESAALRSQIDTFLTRIRAA